MPFSIPEPGLIHLSIPRERWDADDRAAFMVALERSCAEGPTAVLLVSDLEYITEAGPNMVLELAVKLQEHIVFFGVVTESAKLTLTLHAFMTVGRQRGLTFPMEFHEDLTALEAKARTLVKAARAR